MYKNRIEIGDRVNVFFIKADAIFNAEVLQTPLETGDSWFLKYINQDKEHIVYVQLFERMDKI